MMKQKWPMTRGVVMTLMLVGGASSGIIAFIIPRDQFVNIWPFGVLFLLVAAGAIFLLHTESRNED